MKREYEIGKYLVFKANRFLEPKDRMKSVFHTQLPKLKQIFRGFELKILGKCQESTSAVFLLSSILIDEIYSKS